MDQTTKEFLDYLCYIGLVSSDSVNNFLNCLYSNVNSSDKLKEILSNTFYFYIKSLNENILKKISSIVVNNFFINKLKVNIRLINPIFKIYQKFNFKRVKQFFYLWFKKTFSFNTNKEYYLKFWKKVENKLDEYNEDESLINNFSSNKKKFNKKLIRNSYLSSFQNSRTLRSRSNNSSRSIIQDFINRQDEYNKKKKKKNEYLFKQNEEEYNLLYTFSPKIEGRALENNIKKNNNNTNNNKDNDNIYLKLYEDFNKRKNNKNQKEFIYKNIDSSNNTTKRIRNYSFFTNSNENNISINKNLNKKKFDKLYNENKNRNSRIDELTNRLYKENYITYKPNTKKQVYKKRKNIE